MANKKKALPFDSRGGRITVQRILLDSKNYLSLKPHSKVLMTLLQKHWSNNVPVDFGIREASKTIPCARGTASRCFKQLSGRGFITMKDESIFSSRSDSKTRTWLLNWLPYQGKPPTNEWETWVKPP
jgi:hypothetical protein